MEDNFSQESNKNQETGSSLDNFIYPQVHIENESLNLKNSVFKGLFYGKPVALKKVEYESTVNVRNKVDVEKLLSLRNENIVTYHYFFIRDSTSRYLVMDLCIGSMLDYLQRKCLIKLDISRAMFEIAYGLSYLHDQQLFHGCLTLSKILLCRDEGDPDFQSIVKLTPSINHLDNDKTGIEDDLDSLGNIFYSMATKDVNRPKQNLTLAKGSLTELKSTQKLDASIMIKALLKHKNSSYHPTTVKELLLHPFFTINVEHARCLLNDNRFLNVEELQQWYNTLGDKEKSGEFDEDNFQDLKTKVSSTDSISVVVSTAFQDYPEIFSKFIWDVSRTDVKQIEIQKAEVQTNLTFIREREIGRGSFGTVYAGKWIDENKKEIPAACKTLIKEEWNEGFNNEVQALKVLDHLFVIQFLGVCEIESKKHIVMELCEGTLEDYVSKRLERIPKNTLDDKTILGQVTLGLAYIHSKGMIHKDLKPANILLWKHTSESSLVLAKIADFGFAKQLKIGQNEFSETDRPGTKSCMAPELLRRVDTGEKFEASFASDSYSLGITIAYTVLKGQHPYGNSKIVQPILMSSGIDPIYLGELEWDVTDLILKLTKEKPNERPKVGLVIYHPYFSLTNKNTKAHFHEKIGEYFERAYEGKIKKCFTKTEIEKWMEITVREQQSRRNVKTVDMRKALEQMKSKQVEDILEKIEKGNENYSKIKEAITPKPQNQIEKRSFRSKFTLSDLIRNLISTAPQLFTAYIWSLLSNKTIDDYFTYLKVTERGCLYHNIEEYKEISHLKKTFTTFENVQSIYQLIDELPLYALPQDELIEISKCLKNEGSLEEADKSLLCCILNHRWYGKFTLIKTVVENGANPNQHCLSLKRRTAMHLAAENESEEGFEILRFLLQQGGNPNAIDEWERTPLHCAAENESSAAFKMVKLLLKHNGNPDVVDDWKRTLLHCAARNESSGATEMVKLLLGKNGNTKATDNRNQNPLHCAARNESSGAPEIVKLLLGNNGNPNAIDKWYQTPLCYAIRNKSSAGPKICNHLERIMKQSANYRKKRATVHSIVKNKSKRAGFQNTKTSFEKKLLLLNELN